MLPYILCCWDQPERVKGCDGRRLLLDPVVKLPEAHGALGRLHRQFPVIALRDLQRLLVDRGMTGRLRRIDSTVGQFRRADRQGMRRRSARGPSISRAIISIGISLRTAIATVTSSNFFDSAKLYTAASSSSFSPFISFTISSATPKLRPVPRLAGDLVQDPFDLFLDCWRRDGQKPGANRFLGAAQQVSNELCREIGAKAEDFDQFVVRAGAGNDGGKALVGKLAPALLASLRITLSSPRSTMTSVTATGRLGRPEMASR